MRQGIDTLIIRTERHTAWEKSATIRYITLGKTFICISVSLAVIIGIGLQGSWPVAVPSTMRASAPNVNEALRARKRVASTRLSSSYGDGSTNGSSVRLFLSDIATSQSVLVPPMSESEVGTNGMSANGTAEVRSGHAIKKPGQPLDSRTLFGIVRFCHITQGTCHGYIQSRL